MIIKGRTRRMFKPGEEHTKYVNDDGEYVPSATTILKILSKEALQHWANSLGWKRKSIKEELEKSSMIGSLAHGYVEEITKGAKIIDLSPIELHGIEIYNGVANSVTSFIKWWRKNRHRIEIIATERQMNGQTYGGTTDLVCKFDGIPCIIDYKTSKDFYYSMFLQLAGYVDLHETEVDENMIFEQVAILRLDKRNGDEATLLTMTDVIERAGLTGVMNERAMIREYIKAFESMCDLFYKLNDISGDWGVKI
jgi:hypothetical protein